jgi:MFS family permease
MDAFIYSLVLVPALTELLPKSGIPATPGNIGYYGSILFALFLAGWGMSMVWGPVADRFGRVKALMATILMYSVFTFACGLAQNVWQLAVLRIFCGIGLGGEQPIGGTFIAEEWPEDRRKMGAGYMHTGYYFGFFLAALANYVIGTTFGWRWMFLLGGTPALLVGWIQSGVHESAGGRRSSRIPPRAPDARFVRGALQPALSPGARSPCRCSSWCRSSACGRVDLRPDGGDADSPCARATRR